jgi:hypothetical protein
MDLGTELREKLKEIHAYDRVISEEVRTAEGVVVVDVVIHFAEGVL